MLLNSISWFYITTLSYFYGYSFLVFVCQIINIKLASRLSLALIILVGFLILEIFAAYLSIFIPLSLAANLIVGILALLLLVINRATILFPLKKAVQQLKQNRNIFILISVIISLILLFQSSVGPFHYDTGLYHAQAVQWISQYRAVPGLGNLHYRLAYNSLIFPLFALFSFSNLLPHALHSLNGLIILISLLFSLSALPSLFNKPLKVSHLVQLAIAIPLVDLIYDENIFSFDVSSMSTDLSVSALILVNLVLITRYLELNRKHQTRSLLATIITLIIAVIVAIKISTLPLAIFILYFIYQEYSQHNFKNAILLLLGCLFILLPQIVRNLILSGYLIYPLPNLDWFNFDWKIPLEIAVRDQQEIAQWARIPGAEGKTIVEAGFGAWFPVWLNDNKNQGSLQFLFFSLISLALFSLIRLQEVKAHLQKFAIAYITLGIAVVFWFTSAPLVRYGYGFIVGVSILLLVPSVKFVGVQLTQSSKIYHCVLYAYMGLVLALSLKSFTFYPSDLEFLVTPMNYPSVKTKAIPIDNLTIYQPIEGVQGTDQCWDSAFPCTPYVSPQLEVRGNSWQAGFRIRQE